MVRRTWALGLLVIILGAALVFAQLPQMTQPAANTPPSPTPDAAEASLPVPSVLGDFTDPFAYCSAVGTIDQADDRYRGPPVSFAARDQLRKLGVEAKGYELQWRCLDRKLLVCDAMANTPCWHMDTSREPSPRLVAHCRTTRDAGAIHIAIVGHRTIYEWTCRQGEPVIVKQKYHVDSRGFASELWHEVH